MLKEKQLQLAAEMSDLKDTVKKTIVEDESQMSRMKQLLEQTAEELKSTRLQLDMKSAEGLRVLEMLEEQRSKRLEENIATMQLIKEFQKHQDTTKSPAEGSERKANSEVVIKPQAEAKKVPNKAHKVQDNIIQKLPSTRSDESDAQSDDGFTNTNGNGSLERGSELGPPGTRGNPNIGDSTHLVPRTGRSMKKKSGLKKPKLSPDLATKEVNRKATSKGRQSQVYVQDKPPRMNTHPWDSPHSALGVERSSKPTKLNHLSSMDSSQHVNVDRVCSARLSKNIPPTLVQSSVQNHKPMAGPTGRYTPKPTTTELAEQALQTLQKSRKKIAMLEMGGLGGSNVLGSSSKDVMGKTDPKPHPLVKKKSPHSSKKPRDKQDQPSDYKQQRERIQMISQMNVVLAEFEDKIKTMKGDIKEITTK